MQQPDEHERTWSRAFLRLFVTHTHENRQLAGDLKRAFDLYGIDAFVAHDDIAPTREWENEIIVALRSCNVLVALLSADAPASAWVDQECGWAMARDIPIISVDVGIVPYGFLGRYQALPSRGREAHEVARDIVQTLLQNPRTYWTLVEGMVTRFEQSGHFHEANRLFVLLDQLQLSGLTEEHLDRIETAFKTNYEVKEAHEVKRGLSDFLARHRAALKAFAEEERRAKHEYDAMLDAIHEDE